MDRNKKIARIVGALFLTSMIATLVNSNFIGPILNAPLINIYPNKIQVITGALFGLINDIAIVSIAVMLFPILKKHNEIIALGYAGFRIVECVILIVGALSTLLLITLSQEFIKTGAQDASYFQTLGALAVKGHYLANQMAFIIVGLSGLMLCYLLHQSKLIPRFMSNLGLVGYALLLTSALLDLFGIIDSVHGAGIYMYIPGGLFELIFFPVWLIVKGFNSFTIPTPTIDSMPANIYLH
jgi:hypothetical protein